MPVLKTIKVNLIKEIMKKILLTLFTPLALIIGLSTQSYGQNADNKLGIEINGGFMEYQGDHGNSLFFSKKPNYMGAGGSISHYLSPSFDVMLFGGSGDLGYYKSVPYVDPPFDNAGFRARLFNVSTGLRYKFNNDIILSSESKIFPYLVGGVGFQYIHSRILNQTRNNLTEFSGVLTGGGGLQFNINEKVGIRLQTIFNYTYNDIWDGYPFTDGIHKRRKLYDSYMYHSVGVVFNLPYDFLNYEKGPKKLKDSDNDGVPNKFDKCPKTPIGWIVDSVGCPLDSDGDGIFDHADSCRYTKGIPQFDGCPDTDGDGIPDKKDRCPEVAGLAEFQGCPDMDKDGIPDIDDRCPNEAGTAALKGCPDRDGDGVPDIDDKCPDVKGPIEWEGCPDSDGDGIPDHLDRCPSVPGIAANKGCPEIKKQDIQKIALAAKGINFETGKTIITKDSYKNLDILVEMLTLYKEAFVDIEGHTDNVGKSEANKKLSQGRADAVKAYLVSKGIDESRLTAIGYGDEKPVADNKTAAGKAKNRRVDFNIKY